MALTYPVKIEFSEYPSGSWADWSEYLIEAPIISKRVESENEGEAGVIVFDSTNVTFRYSNDTPIYAAFSGDLSAKQRYMFKISAPRSNKTYVPLFEGMADFSTIIWTDPDEGKLISFDIIDKLSALGLIPSYPLRDGPYNILYERNTDTAINNLQVYTDTASTPAHHKHFAIKYGIRTGNIVQNMPVTFDNTPRIGEVIVSPFDETSLAIVRYTGKDINNFPGPTDWMYIDVLSDDSTYPKNDINLGNAKIVNNISYYLKEIYGVDHLVLLYRNNYEIRWEDLGTKKFRTLTPGFEVVAYDGIKLLEVLIKSHWPEINFIVKPSNLNFNIPLPHFLNLVSNTPFGTDPLGALKIVADTLKCYIYIDRNGNFVVQSKESLSTNGITRTIGATKILSKPERKYFWDKLVDGVEVEVKSWVSDEDKNLLVGRSIQTKQIPGSNAFITPKNEIRKELLSSELLEITQEDLDARAAIEARNILDFYGDRRSCFDLELQLDDNTLEWELIDNLFIESTHCFITSLEIDLASRELILTPVEIAKHKYDFRQIVVGMSESNALGGGGGSSYNMVTGGGGGGGGASYLFNAPLLESGGIVQLSTTGNFKITGSSLDLIQNISPTSTPVFNQVTLTNQATLTSHSVRADRTIGTTAPLTGGGDLTANRNFGLSFNTTNLRITSNALNTIQDISEIATPIFAGFILNGINNDAFAHPPTAIINGAYIAIGDLSGGRILPNGMGIKFADAGAAHASIHYLSSNQTINFGRSSGVGHLQIDSGATAITMDLANLRFGINRTLPAATLDVGGSGIISGTLTVNGLGNNYFAGNVGYNVLNPVERISLNGHFRQDGRWSLYNNFISGWTGSGWRLDYDISSPLESTLEADNMFLRGTLSVYELLIQQIRATNGSIYVTACGKIKSITGTPPNEVVMIEDPTGNNLTPFAVDDILIVQEVDLNSTTVIKRIVRRVVSITMDTGGTNVTLGVLAGAPPAAGILELGDSLIRIGNVTNATRQGSLYLTSDDSNAPFMDVIDQVSSWGDWRHPSKLKVRIGKLTGITDPIFGTLDDYGLYASRIYLSSKSTANGIALYADDVKSKFTMYQNGNIIFNFDTATATANIAGWTINSSQLFNGNRIILDAANSTISVNNNAVRMYFTNIDNFGIGDAAGTFHLGSINFIAGWTFNTQRFFNGTDIVLDATNKRISVANNAVYMYHTAANSFGIGDSAGTFHLGSINFIAGWTFNTQSLFKGVFANNYNKISINATTSGSGTNHWEGNNLGTGFQITYKQGSFAHTLTLGEILTDASGNPSSSLRSNWWGVQMLAAAGNVNPTCFFQLSGNGTLYKNIIAGWEFNATQLFNGTVRLESSASLKGLAVADNVRIGEFTHTELTNALSNMNLAFLGYSTINVNDTGIGGWHPTGNYWWQNKPYNPDLDIYLDNSIQANVVRINRWGGVCNNWDYQIRHPLQDVYLAMGRRIKLDFDTRFVVSDFNTDGGTFSVMVYYKNILGIVIYAQVLHTQIIPNSPSGNPIFVNRMNENGLTIDLPYYSDCTGIDIAFGFQGGSQGGVEYQPLTMELINIVINGFQNYQTHISQSGFEVYNSPLTYIKFANNRYEIAASNLTINGLRPIRFHGILAAPPTGNINVGDIYIASDTNTPFICVHLNNLGNAIWRAI